MTPNIDFLIKGSIINDTSCQMQLYDMYCDAMFYIACRYVKNEEDAKDVMQDAFLKAFLNMSSYSSTSAFGAWLKRIVIHQSIDFLKKKKLDVIDKDPSDLQLIDTEDWNFNSDITKEYIIEKVNQLNDKYAIVVKLYLFEGYDHEEISQILDIPIKTSRTQLRRGKLQLQKLLTSKHYGTGY